MHSQLLLLNIASGLQALGFRVNWLIAGSSFECYSEGMHGTYLGQAFTFRNELRFSGCMADLAENVLASQSL